MTRHSCARCGTALSGDEIALYRKLVSRGATAYLCLDCLAQDCATTREKLQGLIDYYHRTGICSLFVQWESPE